MEGGNSYYKLRDDEEGQLSHELQQILKVDVTKRKSSHRATYLGGKTSSWDPIIYRVLI